MLDLVKKHIVKAILFGIVMTIIGFFRGWTIFPLVLLNLFSNFCIYSAVYLVVYVLSDWIYGRIKAQK